jgi:hypothetical protein
MARLEALPDEASVAIAERIVIRVEYDNGNSVSGSFQFKSDAFAFLMNMIDSRRS